jgi:ubiquinone/menaquinone biosynthesis C-methylase UbiE
MGSADRMDKNVLDANIEVHTRMVERYEAEEPHFRPENQAKVRGRLEALRKRVPGGRLLDVGCGTGFIIHLALGVFDEIHGIDITPAMLQRVRTDAGNITLHQAPAEAMPFADASFDAVTAYSFVDHVKDRGALLREVARVLKPGGIFYADLIPSRLFWRSLAPIAARDAKQYPDIVAREAEMVTANDRKVEQQFGIPAALFRAAEPGKEDGGIDPAEFRQLALRSGFSACEASFDWFLGQGAVMHGQSVADAAVIEAYLRRAAPLADHLFKYVYFHAVK